MRSHAAVLLACAAITVEPARASEPAPLRLAIAGYPDPVASGLDRFDARWETGHAFILLDDAVLPDATQRDGDAEPPLPARETHHALYWENLVPLDGPSVRRRGLQVRKGDRWVLHDGTSRAEVEIVALARFEPDPTFESELGHDEVFAIARLPAAFRPPTDAHGEARDSWFLLAAPGCLQPERPPLRAAVTKTVGAESWRAALLKALPVQQATTAASSDLQVRPLSLGATGATLAVLNVPVTGCQSDYGCTEPSQVRVLAKDGRVLHETPPDWSPTHVIVGDVDGDGREEVLAWSCGGGCTFTLLSWDGERVVQTRWEMESGC